MNEPLAGIPTYRVRAGQDGLAVVSEFDIRSIRVVLPLTEHNSLTRTGAATFDRGILTIDMAGDVMIVLVQELQNAVGQAEHGSAVLAETQLVVRPIPGATTPVCIVATLSSDFPAKLDYGHLCLSISQEVALRLVADVRELWARAKWEWPA